MINPLKNKDGTRRRYIPVRYLIPNIITLLGLCAGLTAIRMAIESRFELAIIGIVTAAFLDGLDGPTARKLQATTEFGSELDSLADFVSFGVSPAIILFAWEMGEIKSFGWLIILIYALAMALRLARFNVSPKLEGDDEWKNRYFVGVPAPAAAILVLLPLYLTKMEIYAFRPPTIFVIVHILLISLLAVSQLPTFSLKSFGHKIDFKYVLPIFLLGTLFFALLFTYQYATLVASVIFYLLLIPFSYYRFQSNERKLPS